MSKVQGSPITPQPLELRPAPPFLTQGATSQLPKSAANALTTRSQDGFDVPPQPQQQDPGRAPFLPYGFDVPPQVFERHSTEIANRVGASLPNLDPGQIGASLPNLDPGRVGGGLLDGRIDNRADVFIPHENWGNLINQNPGSRPTSITRELYGPNAQVFVPAEHQRSPLELNPGARPTSITHELHPQGSANTLRVPHDP